MLERKEPITEKEEALNEDILEGYRERSLEKLKSELKQEEFIISHSAGFPKMQRERYARHIRAVIAEKELQRK